MRRTAVMVALVLTSTACLGTDFADSVEGAWQLESGTVGGETIPVVGSHPVTMNLEAGRIGGTAACNSYGGEYDLSGSELSVRDGLSVTEMACLPTAVMISESRYLDALVVVDTVLFEQGVLTLRGPDVELRFTRLDPVPTAELTGTLWVLESLIQGDAVSSTIAGSEPATLQLRADGTFTGSTGCRTISGIYRTTGAEVQFTDWRAEGDCPNQVREQDGRVISALEGGFRVEISGDIMATWVRGDEGLLYRAEP